MEDKSGRGSSKSTGAPCLMIHVSEPGHEETTKMQTLSRKPGGYHASLLIFLKKSITPVKTTNKIPPPGPNRSTFGKNPLYSA